jgi:hypothetical protein
MLGSFDHLRIGHTSDGTPLEARRWASASVTPRLGLDRRITPTAESCLPMNLLPEKHLDSWGPECAGVVLGQLLPDSAAVATC